MKRNVLDRVTRVFRAFPHRRSITSIILLPAPDRTTALLKTTCRSLISAALITWSIVVAPFSAQSQNQQPSTPQDQLDYNAPWTGSTNKARVKKPPAVPATSAQPIPPAQPAVTNPVPPAASAASATNATPLATPVVVPTPDATTPPPSAEMFSTEAPKSRNNEISASGDFLLGQGKVSVPFAFSLHLGSGLTANTVPQAASASRSSDYFGATISYSYKHDWFVDFAFRSGTSSGDTSFTPLSGPVPTHFSIDDQWYQAYIRYKLGFLTGGHFTGYLRAGGTFVTAKLQMSGPFQGALYEQTDNTKDYLGNLGFGLTYRFPVGRRMLLGLQFEGEAFYGRRTQESQETLILTLPQGGGINGGTTVDPTARINNTLYGGIGRATVHLDYNLSPSGFYRLFGDVGFQGMYTLITYPGISSPNELLYGPYARLGFSCDF